MVNTLAAGIRTPPPIEATRVSFIYAGHEPIKCAHAYIVYDGRTMPGHPWQVVIAFYPIGRINSYHPVEIVDGCFEWLGDAMTQVTNAIRGRSLDECEIHVTSQGQPPIADLAWGQNETL